VCGVRVSYTELSCIKTNLRKKKERKEQNQWIVENAGRKESRRIGEGNDFKHWCFFQSWLGEDQGHCPREGPKHLFFNHSIY